MTDKLKPWCYLALATAAQMSTAFISLGVASLIPFLVHPLKLTTAEVGLTGGAVNVGMMALALPAGYLADRYGEKRVLAAACLLTGLSVMAASVMQTFPGLYAVLLFTGFWAGSVTPAGSKLVAIWFPAGGLGFAQSVRQTGVTMGGLLAALLLPFLATRTEWHQAFFLSGLPGLLAALSVGLFYRQAPVGQSPTAGPAGWQTVLETLLDRDVWLTCLTGMFFVGGQFILLSYLQLFLHSRLHLPDLSTGRFLAVLILAGTGGRIFWGFVSDRWFGGGRKPVLVMAGGVTAAASLAMLLVRPPTPLPAVVALTFLLGFAGLGWNGVYVTLLSELGAARSAAATAVGVGISLMQLGVLVLPPLFGYLVDRSHAYRDSWWFMAAVLVLGSVLGGLVREKGRLIRPGSADVG
ncbi:MAG: MFS transporter [Peptococcaceae bacterium]|nr:MFS transporter [Peptococcaceae bacterium]